MKYVQRFDSFIGKTVGKVPKQLLRSSAILGKFTIPSAWATALSVLIIWSLHAHSFRAAYLVILVCIPTATILKLFIRRKRPQTIYTDAMRIKSYSFPSSHAYSGALGGGFLTTLAVQNDMPFISIALVVFVLVIGISRIHVGAHYPSDVLAGWLMGGAVLTAILTLI